MMRLFIRAKSQYRCSSLVARWLVYAIGANVMEMSFAMNAIVDVWVMQIAFVRRFDRSTQ